MDQNALLSFLQSLSGPNAQSNPMLMILRQLMSGGSVNALQGRMGGSSSPWPGGSPMAGGPTGIGNPNPPSFPSLPPGMGAWHDPTSLMSLNGPSGGGYNWPMSGGPTGHADPGMGPTNALGAPQPRLMSFGGGSGGIYPQQGYGQ